MLILLIEMLAKFGDGRVDILHECLQITKVRQRKSIREVDQVGD